MGGGLANGFDLLAPSIRAVVQQRAMPAYRDVPIVQAELGDHAGLVGAASLILWEGEPGAPLAMAQDDKAAAGPSGRQPWLRSSCAARTKMATGTKLECGAGIPREESYSPPFQLAYLRIVCRLSSDKPTRDSRPDILAG